MQEVGSSSRSADHEHCRTSDGVTLARQVRTYRSEAQQQHRRSTGSNSNSSGGKRQKPPTNSSLTTAVNSTKNLGWPGSRDTIVTLQHAGSEGRDVLHQTRTRSCSLPKQVVDLDECRLRRGASQTYDPRMFSRVRRDEWESGSSQPSGVMLQHRSTSSVSLAAPHRRVSVGLYTRHQQADGTEKLRKVPENETAEDRRACLHAAGAPERHTYGRRVTRLHGSPHNVVEMLHRGGIVRRTTVAGGGHQKRIKTARDANIASERLRRGRKRRNHGSHAVSSRLRRMLRLRSDSASDKSHHTHQYHRVYLVLGLLHHKGGGDFVQNGFVCLRAYDVTHEASVLPAEAATFMWDRDRVSPEVAFSTTCRNTPGAVVPPAHSGTHMSLGAESWIGSGGGMMLCKDLSSPTAGALGVGTAATHTGMGQRNRALAGASVAFTWLTANDGHRMSTHTHGSSRPSSSMTVFTIGVRVAVKPSTPSEERKCTTYLRDYLASQLTTYPFLRHYVLITKYKRRRFCWPFCRRRPSPFYVIGKEPLEHLRLEFHSALQAQENLWAAAAGEEARESESREVQTEAGARGGL